MRIFICALQAAALVAFFFAMPVMAQEVVTAAPDTIAAVPVIPVDDTAVVVPYGAWIDGVADLIASLMVPVLLALLARILVILPKPVADVIRMVQVEQLLSRAVDYGISATRGAVKDKTLTVDVGSKVLAEAARYAVAQGPQRLIAWLGGPERVRQMILARLNLEEGADSSAVLSGHV